MFCAFCLHNCKPCDFWILFFSATELIVYDSVDEPYVMQPSEESEEYEGLIVVHLIISNDFVTFTNHFGFVTKMFQFRTFFSGFSLPEEKNVSITQKSHSRKCG